MKKVFAVMAHRWGDEEGHTYLVGVFTEKKHAENCGKAEKVYRGGKYDCIVHEIPLIEDDQTIESDEYNIPKLRVYKE